MCNIGGNDRVICIYSTTDRGKESSVICIIHTAICLVCWNLGMCEILHELVNLNFDKLRKHSTDNTVNVDK
jgi:hypothetical protein